MMKESVIHKLIVANKRIKELESPKHLREQLIKFTEETVNSYVDESTIWKYWEQMIGLIIISKT